MVLGPIQACRVPALTDPRRLYIIMKMLILMQWLFQLAEKHLSMVSSRIEGKLFIQFFVSRSGECAG